MAGPFVRSRRFLMLFFQEFDFEYTHCLFIIDVTIQENNIYACMNLSVNNA